MSILRTAALAVQRFRVPHPRHFCLVTGAPRSGTTAVGDWLLEHARVTGLGESRILIAAYRFLEQVDRFQFLRQNDQHLTRLARNIVYKYYAQSRVLFGRTVLLDKEPLEPVAFPDASYELFLNYVRQLLPNVRFLFMVREPVSTIWSMHRRKWGYSATDIEPQEFPLDRHIDTWRNAAELVLSEQEKADVYVCQYDRLVEDSKAESIRICEFLGIRYSDPFLPRESQSVAFDQATVDVIRGSTDSLWHAVQSLRM